MSLRLPLSFSTLALAAALLAACDSAPAGAPVVTPKKHVTAVTMDLNGVRKWDLSNGDTWDPFWADDGELYSFNCDGWGFGLEKKRERNIAFNKLSGETADTLAGTLVNEMPDYGVSHAKGPDGATWKVTGHECIDSVFYAFVSRHIQGNAKDSLRRQTAVNASLIKSTDRGVTWTRAGEENLAKPMWPGSRFGAPYFVHYGRNGGRVTHDGADRYVYAISNNGFWNNGDDYVLGRVPREKIAELNPGDWTYYRGGDGMKSASWTPDLQSATPIISKPAECGTSAPTYIPALGIYMMVLWHHEVPYRFFAPKEITYDFYQAEHVWGPWTKVSSHSDQFIASGHMYAPSLCTKFQETRGDEVRITMFTSGYPHINGPEGLYKLWTIPLVLKTTPQAASVFIPNDDPRISYSGNWRVLQTNKKLGVDVRCSDNAGDSATFSFTGTGVACVAERSPDSGAADVYLDGKLLKTVELGLANFPTISNVQIHEETGLKKGPHQVKVVNKRGGAVRLSGFRVIGAPVAGHDR